MHRGAGGGYQGNAHVGVSSRLRLVGVRLRTLPSGPAVGFFSNRLRMSSLGGLGLSNGHPCVLLSYNNKGIPSEGSEIGLRLSTVFKT